MRKDKIVNGIRLAIDEKGTGSVVILIHGINSTKELMYMIRDKIDNHFKVVCYDTRGYGESERVANFTIEDHAKDLIELAESYDQKVSVVGFSMGSYIALMAAEMRPDIFEKIVLIGTRGRVSKSSMERILEEKGLDINSVSQTEMAKILQCALFAPTTPYSKMVRGKKYQSTVSMTNEEKRAATEALKNFDLFTNIKKVTADVLCLTGESDGINPPQYGEAVAKCLQNGRFDVIKKSGHMVMMENLEDLTEKINSFLKEK